MIVMTKFFGLRSYLLMRKARSINACSFHGLFGRGSLPQAEVTMMLYC
jgi:hypothetical protein